MPEPLNPGKVFQMAYGAGSHDFGRTAVAMPSIAGSVIAVNEVPAEIFLEVLKSLLNTLKETGDRK